ncbi:Nuclear pore complex protein NUP98A [Camellia lanceoleosa]|uniref:Nuclear pore complex protein NUP98A n=1 Tax=Camellia lanceoleosa TaxID=1840588 RepID=A0ACC0GFW9_9ERIC|nr:Nuclear pore complex protein NUP98A [Camellia lanceoleosa]
MSGKSGVDESCTSGSKRKSSGQGQSSKNPKIDDALQSWQRSCEERERFFLQAKANAGATDAYSVAACASQVQAKVGVENVHGNEDGVPAMQQHNHVNMSREQLVQMGQWRNEVAASMWEAYNNSCFLTMILQVDMWAGTYVSMYAYLFYSINTHSSILSGTFFLSSYYLKTTIQYWFIIRFFVYITKKKKKKNSRIVSYLITLPWLSPQHCTSCCGSQQSMELRRSVGINCRTFVTSSLVIQRKPFKAVQLALSAMSRKTIHTLYAHIFICINVGTTPTFGQSTSASGSSSFFGTALSSFGDQNSFLGSQSTTPTFGTTGFGQSVFCSQHGRSRVAAYTVTAEVDDGSSAAKLESISAMTINKDKGHEELRWESVWKLLVLVIHLEGVKALAMFALLEGSNIKCNGEEKASYAVTGTDDESMCFESVIGTDAECLMCCFLFSGHGLIAVAAYYWRLLSGWRLPSG